jgi:hypothetical protein
MTRTLPSLSTGSTRFKIDWAYQNNRLRSVAQNGGTTTYWTGNSSDAFGHYQDELFGNGIVTISDFDQASGLMASREAGIGGGIEFSSPDPVGIELLNVAPLRRPQ